MIINAMTAALLATLQVAAFPSDDEFQATPKTPVMVVGTFHFHQTDTPDVMTPENQAAIEGIVEQFAGFEPTIVGLECRPDEEDGINAAYAAWQVGEHELTRNERQQIGFRLAARAGLDGIDCLDTDFPPAPNFDAFDGWDEILAYAEEQGDDERYKKWIPMIERRSAAVQDFRRTASLGEVIDFMNGPDAQMSQSRMLIVEMDVGIRTNWAGPDFYGRFEGRNARIFASTNLVAGPDDRVLMLFGNAHKLPLERMFRDSFEFEVVPVPRFAGDDQ